MQLQERLPKMPVDQMVFAPVATETMKEGSHQLVPSVVRRRTVFKENPKGNRACSGESETDRNLHMVRVSKANLKGSSAFVALNMLKGN